MLAAEAAYDAVVGDDADATVANTGEIDAAEAPLDVTAYDEALHGSWVAAELKKVRNVHAAFHWGLLPGMVYAGFSTFISNGNEPWTLKNAVRDSAKTKAANLFEPIECV